MGKTESVIEPMIAKDIKKKRFLIEASKSLAYSLLSTRKAKLTDTFNNTYLNKNFNLSMIEPTFGNEDFFNSYISELTKNGKPKNLGVTYISNERESIDRIIRVCNNFNINYLLVDPLDSNSVGINPFENRDSYKVASNIVELIYLLISPTDSKHKDDNGYSVNGLESIQIVQIFQNLAILLKETYPITHTGQLPTIEDMLKLLLNFKLIEALVEKNRSLFSQDKFPGLLEYFETNFYEKSPASRMLQRKIKAPTSILDNIIKNPSLKTLLCNRNNNVNFDDAIQNGKVLLFCLRKGELSSKSYLNHKSFRIIDFQSLLISIFI